MPLAYMAAGRDAECACCTVFPCSGMETDASAGKREIDPTVGGTMEPASEMFPSSRVYTGMSPVLKRGWRREPGLSPSAQDCGVLSRAESVVWDPMR
mgnify:CR=1 FL=1